MTSWATAMTSEDISTEAWLETRRVTVEPVDDGTIVGIGYALDACRSVVGLLRHGASVRSQARLPRGLLMTGAPGTGKTLSARWLVSQLGDVECFNLPIDDLEPKRIREAFAILSTRPRSVVLLPEIDAVGLDRRSSDRESRRSLFALLEALDGLVPVAADRGPIVIATTNREPWALDDGLTRPLRLGVHIRYSAPTCDERRQLFATLGATLPVDTSIDWERCAELTGDWTPAAIRAAIDAAYGAALLRDGEHAKVTEGDILNAIARAGQVEGDKDAAASPMRVAIHEAGHVAVALALGLMVRAVRIGPRPGHGKTETGPDAGPEDDGELRASVIVAMGGAAAERALLGEATLGSQEDVRAATRALIARVEAGIDPAFAPVSRGAWGEWVPKVVDERISTHVLASLEAARTTAAELVRSNSGAIQRLADELLKVGLLSGLRLRAALESSGLVKDCDGSLVRESGV